MTLPRQDAGYITSLGFRSAMTVIYLLPMLWVHGFHWSEHFQQICDMDKKYAVFPSLGEKLF